MVEGPSTDCTNKKGPRLERPDPESDSSTVPVVYRISVTMSSTFFQMGYIRPTCSLSLGNFRATLAVQSPQPAEERTMYIGIGGLILLIILLVILF